MLPFLGDQLLNKHTHVETKADVKPTKTGHLLHYKSHVHNRHKRGLERTMLDRAFRLSSKIRHTGGQGHYYSRTGT